MVGGNITVEDNGVLNLLGTCSGDLVIKSGGIANVQGSVIKNVNNAGHLILSGVIYGTVHTKDSPFEIIQDAIVHGDVIQ